MYLPDLDLTASSKVVLGSGVRVVEPRDGCKPLSGLYTDHAHASTVVSVVPAQLLPALPLQARQGGCTSAGECGFEAAQRIAHAARASRIGDDITDVLEILGQGHFPT